MLEAKNLVRRFGDLTAVDNVSFTVGPGRIFGLLGPNGAGKTTTISMISGLLKPTDGKVEVEGFDVRKEPKEVARRIGVVPQEIALYEDLNALENLNFWGGIYGMSGASLKSRIAELLELVGLTDRAKSPVKQYSGGMKRRLNLAMGIIHKPKLILLDEPTVGIDPQAREKILDVVERVVEQGNTVLYTTHYLEEAEKLCHELAIMDQGKILAQGSITELRAQLGEGSLIVLSGSFTSGELTDAMSQLRGLQTIEVSDGKAMLSLPRDGSSVGQALESIFATKLQLDDVSVKQPNLEDLFIKLTGRELRD